jgi:hypothetical protein
VIPSKIVTEIYTDLRGDYLCLNKLPGEIDSQVLYFPVPVKVPKNSFFQQAEGQIISALSTAQQKSGGAATEISSKRRSRNRRLTRSSGAATSDTREQQRAAEPQPEQQCAA